MTNIVLCPNLSNMASVKKEQVSKVSAEEKILSAARKLFTERGLHAVKTRDIASEAGINLALLNYYFRSKEMLYARVMSENLTGFKRSVSDLFGNENMDLFEKIEHLSELYFLEFGSNPELLLFIFNTMHQNPELFLDGDGMQQSRMVLFKQIEDLMKKKKIKKMHPAHVMMNLMSMTMFPYLMFPFIKQRAKLDDAQMRALLKDRVTLIPEWMKLILKP